MTSSTTTTAHDSSTTDTITTQSRKLLWIVLSNAIIAIGWGRVFMMLLLSRQQMDSSCSSTETSAVSYATRIALYLSFLEVLNAMIGVTRSKVSYTALFACIRFGVETILAPMLFVPCDNDVVVWHWSHTMTVFCWSFGDCIRFTCFFLDAALVLLWNNSSILPKYIRYTVGPILFPIGTAGEMTMVVYAASRSGNIYQKYVMYFCAFCLWPCGFYPLMKQLLKQRAKFIQSIRSNHSLSNKKQN